MKTIALRYGETFAPEGGTIKAHQDVIDKMGYVWYGKLGSRVAKPKQNEIMKAENPCILLIQSGKGDRHWAYIDEVSETPELNAVPEYYRMDANKFKTWFKITRFEKADKDIMSKCFVVSSHSLLMLASG